MYLTDENPVLIFLPIDYHSVVTDSLTVVRTIGQPFQVVFRKVFHTVELLNDAFTRFLFSVL